MASNAADPNDSDQNQSPDPSPKPRYFGHAYKTDYVKPTSTAPISQLVHRAGKVIGGVQDCLRCGMSIARPPLSPFAEFALIRVIDYDGFRNWKVEKTAAESEMCPEYASAGAD